jgi:predicted AAA+ superfamily ATPase
MIKKIINFFKEIRNIFHDEFEDERELELIEALKCKQESLKKFNGKMHVSDRGGLSLRFKSKVDEAAYHKHLVNSWASNRGDKNV